MHRFANIIRYQKTFEIDCSKEKSCATQCMPMLLSFLDKLNAVDFEIISDNIGHLEQFIVGEFLEIKLNFSLNFLKEFI